MKRVLKTLGLTKAAEAGSPAVPSDPPSGTAPAQVRPPAPPPSARVEPPQACPEPVEGASPTQSSAGVAELDPFHLFAPTPGATVVTLDSTNKILSANEACGAMFGWEAEALVGQPLEVLLHQGLDQHVTKWLQQRRSEDANETTALLQVVARRKDGTEFPASVTPLTWDSDTTLTRRSEAAPGCWTAVLRSLVVGVTPPSQSQSELEATQADEQLPRLQGEIDALTATLAAEHEAAFASRQRADTLQDRMAENAASFERATTEMATQAAGQERAQSELRLQLETAEGLTKQLEAARDELLQRNHFFDEAWLGLRQQQDELTGKRMAEQQATVESKQRIQALEERLRDNKAELDRLSKKVDRDERSQMELGTLQHVADALRAKLTSEQWTATGTRRRQDELEKQLVAISAESERIKTDRDKFGESHARLEAELHAPLQAAKLACEQLDGALKGTTARCSELETELANLQQARQEMSQCLLAEQQAEAASKQRGSELQNRLRARTAELTQVKLERDNQARRRAQLLAERQAEHARLQQERDALDQKLAAAQQEQAAAKQHHDQLQEQLRQAEQAQAELNQRMAEQTSLASELRAELTAARTETDQAQAELKETSSVEKRLEQELDNLRQERHENYQKFAAEKQASQKLRRQVQDLEQQLETRLRESAAEADRTKTALESQAAERTGLEPAAGHPAGNSEEMTTELHRLREIEAAQRAELAELDNRLRHGVTALARVTAELEKERGERRRVEQRSVTLTAQLQELHGNLKHHLESDRATSERLGHLEAHLRQQEDAVTHATTDLQKEMAARELAEQQLRATEALIAQLRNCVSSFEQAKGGFKRMQDQLESRLQTSMKALSESQTRLQQETAERRRLDEDSATARRSFEEQTQTHAIELAKLQAELQSHQFERQRLETEAIHSRYASVDSARVGSNMVNSFRRRIRSPIDLLIQSSRRLLELGLETEQKQLAESVLENALLLHCSLQESNPSNPSSARADANDGPAPELPAPPPDPIETHRQP